MKHLLLTLPLLMLAACNNGPQVEAENASIEEVADKVRDAGGGNAAIVSPGKWQSSVTLETIEIPGMPAEAAAQIKKTMAKAASGHAICLKPEQVRKPNEDFFAGNKSNCRYDKFSMDGGKMSGTMRCTQPGGTQVIQFDGQYAPDHYEMRMASTVEGAGGPGGPMKMVMRIEAKRIGDCDAEPAAPVAAN